MDEAGEVGACGRGVAAEALAAAELGEVVGGQIGPPVPGVLAYVPEDVGELEGEAEGVGVLGGAVDALGAGLGSEDAEESRPIAPATQRQ